MKLVCDGSSTACDKLQARFAEAERQRDAAIESGERMFMEACAAKDEAVKRADQAEARTARMLDVLDQNERLDTSNYSLRSQLKEAEARAEDLRTALGELLALVDHELDLAKCRNGVTDSTGTVDQGETVAYKTIMNARTALEAAGEGGVR